MAHSAPGAGHPPYGHEKGPPIMAGRLSMVAPGQSGQGEDGKQDEDKQPDGDHLLARH